MERPFSKTAMMLVIVGMGIAFVGLCFKRLFGVGYMWWEHGSDRCRF